MVARQYRGNAFNGLPLPHGLSLLSLSLPSQRTNNATANCNVEFKVPCRTAVTFDSNRDIKAFFQVK